MRLKGAGIPVALGYGVDDLAVLYSPIHSKYCVVDDYMWSWTVLSTGTPPPSFPTISYGMGLRARTSLMAGRELLSAGVLLLELLDSMALVKVDLSGQGRITMKSEMGY